MSVSVALPALPCLCASFRRTARAMTQMYEKKLRPLGLRSTQLTILQVLARTGELSQGQMGRILAMDSTSLTRTLRVMARQGWVEERRGEDRRERLIRMTDAGEALLRRAQPVWDEVQAELRGRLGDQLWSGLAESMQQATNLLVMEGEAK
jgi:DNA-binding MarR family transcriptional regulator